MEGIMPKEGEWPCQTEIKIGPPARLEAALYRLLRDEIQPGRMEAILIDIKHVADDCQYTNEHLRILARRHAAYLMEA